MSKVHADKNHNNTQVNASFTPHSPKPTLSRAVISDGRPVSPAQMVLQDIAKRGEATQFNAKLYDSSLPEMPHDNRPNGLPTQLRGGIEALSGFDMGDVTVHKGSSKPAQFNAHAYAQGSQIHLASGQEKHLPHEAWHVVQQKQGRVKPTIERNGLAINNDQSLEDEADKMGEKALSFQGVSDRTLLLTAPESHASAQAKMETIQLAMASDLMMSSLWNFFKSHSINSVLKAGDIYVLNKIQSIDNMEKIYAAMTNLQALLTNLLNIWDLVPAPVRTILLYLAGKALGAHAANRREALVVGLDQDPSESTIAWIVKALGLAITAYTSPVSSAFGFAKYMLGYGEKKEQAGVKSVPQTDDQDVANIDLKLIGLDVKKLKLQKQQEPQGKSPIKPEEKGGLHASFALWIDMFGRKSTVGDSGNLKMILPWDGPSIVHLNEDLTIINTMEIPPILRLKQFQLNELLLEGKSLKTLKMSIAQLGVADDHFIIEELEGKYSGGSVAFESSLIKIQVFNWSAEASKAELAFATDNSFKSASLSGFKESSGMFKVESACIDKDQASIEKASITLPESTGIDLRAEASLQRKAGKTTGKGQLTSNRIELFGNKVVLDNVTGAMVINNDGWGVKASAQLNMSLPHLDSAQGKFDVSYQHLASGKDSFDLNLKEGRFESDFDAFSLSASEMEYTHQTGTFTVKKATVKIKAIDTTAEVSGVEISQEGISFTEAQVAYKGTISPFSGFELENPNFAIVKSGKGYLLSASAGLSLSSSAMNVACKAEVITLTFAKGDYSGELQKLEVTSSAFALAMASVKANKQGLEIGSASITLGSSRDEVSDSQVAAVTQTSSGLFDFLPFAKALKFSVTGVSVTQSGLKITGFKPEIPPIDFNAFGIKGGVDFETYSAYLNGDKSFQLTDYLSPSLTEVSVTVPVFPMLSAGAFIRVNAGIGFSAALAGKHDENMWQISGKGGLKGEASVEAGVKAVAGTPLVAALEASFSAEGKAAVDANANISGGAYFDKDSKTFKQDPKKPFGLDYDCSASVTASVNFKLKGKALMFYEKTIYQYKFGQWNLGEYQMQGKLGSTDGQLTMGEPGKLGMKGDTLSVPSQTHKGDKATELLESDEYIYGGGEPRLISLNEKQAQVITHLNLLAEEYQSANALINGIESKYIALITYKDTLYRLEMSQMSETDTNDALQQFNHKWNIETLLESYRENQDKLVKVDMDIVKFREILAENDKLVAVNLDEGGSKPLAKVDLVNQQSKKLKVPKLDSFIENFSSASDRLGPIVAKKSQSQQAIDRIMPLDSFIQISTTKGRVFTNPRNRIKQVDRALIQFHQEKNQIHLETLKAKILHYLAEPDSSRTTAVNALLAQVKAAVD
ncbi:protein of unknown function (DUF4157) [Shewanella psychrophila]|uniref:eCIS core domain-containing protein n=1 Tax=Shewanella psychrophila TaxID=225848 RepID=A0A1S6HNV5_9GAMM|nr:DUF4157 domain-containing protein [Shewanella psychrophila]AQS37195.1 protein of unknown function (DUF4157) [Shewanella psychrophila]